MYKDKDKQREAVKEATRRYRQRKQGITRITQETARVIPESVRPKDLDGGRAFKYRGELTKARQTSRKGFNE